jgi:hypothetical protein
MAAGLVETSGQLANSSRERFIEDLTYSDVSLWWSVACFLEKVLIKLCESTSDYAWL